MMEHCHDNTNVNDTHSSRGYVLDLFNSFFKEDSSGVLLQEFDGDKSDTLCNGRLLLSHNSKLLLNLSTSGEITVWVDLEKRDLNTSFLNTNSINLEKLDLDIIFKNENNTIVTEAIWSNSSIKDNKNMGICTIPTLVLLEQDINANNINESCSCRQNSNIKYLTIIQFINIDKLEIKSEYNIIKLEIENKLNNNDIYGEPISINFSVPKDNLKHKFSDNMDIRYCRIHIESIFNTFFNGKLLYKKDNKLCDSCFSHNNLRIFTDNSNEYGFLILMSNILFVSLDFNGCKSLYAKRRFLLQDNNLPLIRYSGAAALNNWLLCITIDTYELLIWNYYDGIGFLRFDLKEHIKKYFTKLNAKVKISFCNGLSNIIVLIDNLNELCIDNNSVKLLKIDLDGLFSKLICSYYTIKLLYDKNDIIKTDMFDPEDYLRKNILISSGSIPHVQLDNEYKDLTIYPHAFNNFKLNKFMKILDSKLSGGSTEYLNILKLIDSNINWSYFYCKNWLIMEYYNNKYIQLIVLNTIKNIISNNDNNEILLEYESLFNDLYLKSIKSYIETNTECSKDYITFLNNLNIGSDLFDLYASVIEKTTDNIKNNVILPCIKVYKFTLSGIFFKNIYDKNKLLGNYLVDIVINSKSVLIQISDENIINNHLSFYFDINDCYGLQIINNIDKVATKIDNNINFEEDMFLFNIKNKYAILSLKLSHEINWNCYFMNKDFKTYIGIYSHKMSLLGLIYSAIRYQDFKNIKRICLLNNIDESIIPIIQLDIGINNSEIDIVKSSLNNIPSILDLKIVKFAIFLLLENNNSKLSDEFIVKSCEIFLNFCLNRIKYYINDNIRTYNSNDYSDSILKSLSYYSSLFRERLCRKNDISDSNNTNESVMQVKENYLIFSELKTDKDIYLRDEIIEGHYSTLINWWYKSNNTDITYNLNSFRNNILYQVYKLICNQNSNSLTLGIHMLRQIGENTTEYLKLILYYTLRRDIRKKIINHLKHINCLNDDDHDLIQFSNQLENYYFNTCYEVELNRIWTSFLTYSYPYDILRDYIHILNENEDKKDSENSNIEDSDEEDYSYEHISKSLTYPFGGLKTLKDGILINTGLEINKYENNKYILKISKVILKKLSNVHEINNTCNNTNFYINNKEYIQIDKSLLYSHFSKESLDIWSGLNCKEIQDNELNLEKDISSYFNNENINYENHDNELNNTFNGILAKSLPEQENNYLKLSNNKIINIKNSICKFCCDQNDEDCLDIEEKILYFDKKKECMDYSRNSYVNDEVNNNNYDLSSNIDKKNDKYLSGIDSNNQNDQNSKRGDLTWLRLNRERKALMNNHFNNYGYINHSLYFITLWPYDVAIRIMIEKTHLQICYIWNRILRKYQTPCKYNEAFVYSYLYLMIKKINKEENDSNMLLLLNNKFDLETTIFKKITTIIYNSLFGFIFSHFDWMNIPQAMNYLSKTLSILRSNYNVKRSYTYELINDIIRENFNSNPKYINEVFINSLISSKLLLVHYLKSDLLENKLHKIEMNKYYNVKHIINKCISYEKHGPRLFKYYLCEINDLTGLDYLNLFLKFFKKEKQNKYTNDYLSILYIFMNKKEEIVLMFFRDTFTKFKNSIGDELYNKLLLNNNNIDKSICVDFKFILKSPITMLNILIDYFVNYYNGVSTEDDEDNARIYDYDVISEFSSESNNENIDNILEEKNLSENNFYDYEHNDNDLKLRPHYVLSIIFSLNFCKNDIYNKNYKLFLEKYFPKLKELLKYQFKYIGDEEECLNEKLTNIEDTNLFNIFEIIKATYKESKTLIDLIDLFPVIYHKLCNKDNIEEIVNFFSHKMYESIKKNDDLKMNFKYDIYDIDNGFKLNLPILNYISKGRPFMAYILLCMRYKCYTNNINHYDENFCISVPNLNTNDKINIYKAIYNLSIRNFTREIVVTSSIIFISMLDLPTELLTTDIRVARCIYNHQIHPRDSLSKPNYDSEMNIEIDSVNSDKIYEIWNLFIKFGPPQIDSYIINLDNNECKLEFKDNQKYSNSLFIVLKMLEEAAWDTGDITIRNSSNKDTHSTNNDDFIDNDYSDIKLLESTPIWHLVAVFCRLHNLPRSLTLLHELARRGEWVQFLQECDSQKCPKETVENIINEYISEYPVLKQHLKIALKMNNDDKYSDDDQFEYNNKESEYIISLLDWNIYFTSKNNVEYDKLHEFYEWSIKNVFIDSLMDMNGVKLLMYYSVIQENFNLFIDFNLNINLKCLASYTINSYIIIEFINSLIFILKNNTEYNIEFLFNKIKFDDDTNKIEECKSIFQIFIMKVINDFKFMIINNKDVKYDNIDINNDLNVVLEYDDNKLNEYIEHLMLNSITNISEIMNKKYKINEEYIKFILKNNIENNSILCMDELTIILWKLMSILNEGKFLSRISNWFYGEKSIIYSMFNVLGCLRNLDINHALKNTVNILIKNDNISKKFNLFNPSDNLITLYYENELLYIYKNISIKNHELLWNFVYDIYLYNSDDNLNKTFNLKHHLYKKNIVNLLYLDFNEYNLNCSDLEKWLCMTEIEIIKEIYDTGRYRLLIKYLEISSNTLLNNIGYNSEKISLLEDSTLKLVSNELDSFISTHLFKSNSIRYEYLSNYYWNLLKNLSDSIKKISLYIAPYIFSKISIYCWYLIEKQERLLTIIDQVILLSISLSFLSDSYKLFESNQINNNNIGLYSDNYLPVYFDLNYIYDCIHCLCYKLLFLYTINMDEKEVYFNNSGNCNKIEYMLKHVIYIVNNNKCNIVDIRFNYNVFSMEYYENLFLKIRNNSILFTPSGYFNFQNTNDKNFNLQLPNKINFSDFPVDAKHLMSSISNITNYFVDLILAFRMGIRFIPSFKNKLVHSYRKFQKKFNLLKNLYSNEDNNIDNSNFQSENNYGSINKNNGSYIEANNNNIVSINRNSHIWNQIIDFLMEKYYVSLMLTKIIYLWSKEDKDEINNFIDNLSSKFLYNFNNNDIDKQKSRINFWDEYIILSNNNKKVSEVDFNIKLFSFIRIFHYIHQIEKYKHLDKIINDIKYYTKDLIVNSELNTEFNTFSFNTNDLFNDESYLTGTSKFIINLFSTESIICIVENVLFMSVELNLKYNNSNCNGEVNSIGFDDLLDSIRIITSNNIYLDVERLDDSIINILFEIIRNFSNEKNITVFLYKISKLSLNHIYVIEKINSRLNEYNNNEITSIKESIYINLVLYYLTMIDYNSFTCESNDYYQTNMANLIDNIDILLNKMINTDFDCQLFSNIILEIPELFSFSQLSYAQINNVIENIKIFQNIYDNDYSNICKFDDSNINISNINGEKNGDDNEYKIENSNDSYGNSISNNITNTDCIGSNNVLPKNLLSMILAIRIFEIYNSRDGNENNNINLNILKNLNRIDLLAEFLVNKCLIKQWNKTSIEFIFSKYGRYDLFIALQVIFHSCELLKNTKYQQLYSAYLKLAGLFSIQMYFIDSYIQENSFKSFNNDNYLTKEMKESIKNKLSFVIPNEYINELFNDYKSTDFSTDINNNDDKIKFEYQVNKVNIINLDLIELFEIVSNNNICHNPILVNVILSGYEVIFGPIVHAIWPRILFINSIILSNSEYINKYKHVFGYLDFNILESMSNLHKNLLLYLNNKEYDNNNYSFYRIIKSNNENSDIQIFDSALEWIERPETKYNVNKDSLFVNWKNLVSEYVDDILLRIEICNMVDPIELSETISYNKRLYNDKSLYEIV
ncbi:hypothetical protein FG386_001511 [Cryptosporidium ryanae]|uniref:uncharacterized protein n=1 Tax=Cryptosporidium ryanae TaxID=515981 RepID=UPI00351AA02F|nr:hypothetical protein FG386_001511 [Cryptosporidium ryanae]